MESGVLSPAGFDHFIREWLGYGNDMNASPSHVEITRLFQRHCELSAAHPGVRQRPMVSKANRLRSAYDAATEEQKRCLLDGLFQLAPVNSETWRTAELKSKILPEPSAGAPRGIMGNGRRRSSTPPRNRDRTGPKRPHRSVPSMRPPARARQWSPSDSPSSKPTPGPDRTPSAGCSQHQSDEANSESALPSSQRDFFLSHAGENKDFGRLLVDELEREGATVWFDEFEIMLGDRITDAISEGLAGSRLGITLLSPEYIAKKWPMEELNTLLSLEDVGDTRILPVLHNLSHDDLLLALPFLANRRYIDSSTSPLSEVVDQLMARLQRDETRAQ